jgi:ComF family protein
VCGEVFESSLALAFPDTRCRICQSAPPPFERAVAYGSYHGALRDLVHLLKFDQVRPAANELGRRLAETIAALDPSLPEGKIVVVPVPLHKSKQRQRGFNQAEMIVRAALERLAHPERFELLARTMARVRDTGSQIGLTRHQRRDNLRGAFVVHDASQIGGRTVLLVDDVYTTGATAAECARVLRRAGAAHVFVSTVGRTLKVFDLLATREELLQAIDAGQIARQINEPAARRFPRIAAHG